VVDALFFCALFCGFYAAWHGSRTAYALIAMTAVDGAMALVLPFDFGTWLILDIATMGAIEMWPTNRRDHAVVALFPPCWALYQLDAVWTSQATTLIVAAMFMLTPPWERIWIARRGFA
jgi:hypothetical protein